MKTQPKEHILICLSSSPSNVKIIQTAGEMAKAYQGTLTALFVETPDYPYMQPEDQKRLQKNIELAKQLGASLEQVSGEDISYQIAEYARINGITKIVVGQSSTMRNVFGTKSLTERLPELAPDAEIFIIPDGNRNRSYRYKQHPKTSFSFFDLFQMLLILTAVTGLSLLFYRLGFTDANIITLYILGVLLISIRTEKMVYSVLASMASVIVFNFFFTDPRYTLLAYDIGYPMTFIVMFLASLMTGTLASKMKILAKQSANQAYRTQILLETNQALQQAKNQTDILLTTRDQLTKLTGREAKIELDTTEKTEKDFTESENRTERRYPIHIGHQFFGTASLDISQKAMDVSENSIVLSILGECALALENEKNNREKEQSAVLAKNEQLRANLLRTISHDLRTPLTSISGNASNLLTNEDDFSPEIRQQLYLDIYDDSMWLYHMVENLLSVTRMEGEGVNLQTSVELLEDLVEEALHHVDRRASEHSIHLKKEAELLMVRVDGRLIMQVVINLVNNAIKYTQAGSEITILVRKNGNFAEVSVSDNGNGIPDEKKEQVFEMFYSGEKSVADGKRSMGLGLPLCKAILSIHGGKISLEDAETGGARFTFTLPIEEVELHE